jgi:steroid 5-alpha reductase family enzyme
MAKLSRTISFLIVFLVYAAAFLGGMFVFNMFPGFYALPSFFIADIAATVIVWAFGLIFKNASMYDPYWSVAPIALIISFLFFSQKIDVSGIMLLAIFLFWGVRLTLNWAVGWSGLSQQDWRYTMLKRQRPRLWFLTNFFGINLMPTLFVFAGMTPAFYSVTDGSDVSAITFVGAAVCASAVLLEIFADSQMRSFKSDPANSGRNIQNGLWRYSRHPNYFGEISFWWGVWIVQISLINIWWTVFAPIAMTALFVFISIPMMEKRLIETKEGYAEYKKATSMLVPLSVKNKV